MFTNMWKKNTQKKDSKPKNWRKKYMKYKAQKEQKCPTLHKNRYSLMRILIDREEKSKKRREKSTSHCEVGITRGEPRGGKTEKGKERTKKWGKLLAATHCVAWNLLAGLSCEDLVHKNRYSLMRSIRDREEKSRNRRERGWDHQGWAEGWNAVLMMPKLPRKVRNEGPLMRGMRKTKTKQNQTSHPEAPPYLKCSSVSNIHLKMWVLHVCTTMPKGQIPSATQSAYYAVNQTQAISKLDVKLGWGNIIFEIT